MTCFSRAIHNGNIETEMKGEVQKIVERVTME